MKSFAISILLTVLMLSGIVWNAIYINNVADRMNEMLSALPDVGNDDCSGAAQEIADYWEKNSLYVGLSVSYTVADRVSEQAATLCACAECNDLFGYRTALALLRDAVGDMRRLEQFSLENLM